jgi:hypothetical protein
LGPKLKILRKNTQISQFLIFEYEFHFWDPKDTSNQIFSFLASNLPKTSFLWKMAQKFFFQKFLLCKFCKKLLKSRRLFNKPKNRKLSMNYWEFSHLNFFHLKCPLIIWHVHVAFKCVLQFGGHLDFFNSIYHVALLFQPRNWEFQRSGRNCGR